MRIINAYVCDYAFMANGKMSLIGIFSNFNFNHLPDTIPMFYIALHIEAEPNESMTLGARITNPNGRILREVSIPNLRVGNGTGTFEIWPMFLFGGVEFSETGQHVTEIIVGQDVVHYIPLQVNMIRRQN